MSTDLFGQPVNERTAPLAAGVKGKRKPTKANGYAATPGGGPAGEKCKTCAHYSGVHRNKIYRKCELLRAVWTGGPGTDIKANSPACQLWKKPEPTT